MTTLFFDRPLAPMYRHFDWSISVPVPQYTALFNPVLQAIKKLGGSASIAELDEEVTNNLRLTNEDIAEPHNDRRTILQPNVQLF